jgi:mono/diheme cytochrome c family protein
MPGPRLFVACCLIAFTAVAGGCGNGIQVSQNLQPEHHGAVLFNERCSGCHTLDAADAFGSKPEGKVQQGERTDGPNFNVRRETRQDVLFAIRNGGFSGAIMPANVVVGKNAQDVALFLERYAGSKSTTQGAAATSPSAQK